jgi:hypothetical protein
MPRLGKWKLPLDDQDECKNNLPCECKARDHKCLLEVLNVPSAILEVKPRVNKKSLVSRPAFGFIIFRAPHFRNPYLTKVTKQLGSTLLITPIATPFRYL